MKFLCRNCKAKYQIADEKVAGRTLRMTCQQCGEAIMVRGPGRAAGAAARPASHPLVPAPMAAPASALGAEFQRQLGGTPVEAGARGPDEWHVAINDTPVGPMRRDEVARKIANGAIDSESLAWREGMDDWLPARHIPELAVLFEPRAPVPAPPPPMIMAPPPQAVAQPAARVDMAPIGGRQMLSLDEYAAPDPVVSTVTIEPVQTSESRSENKPLGWAPMFALVSGGAFILAMGLVLGARVLAPQPPVAAPVAEPVPAALRPEVVAVEDEQSGESTVIELDLQDIAGEAQAAAAAARRPATTTTAAATAQADKAKGKQLTQEQKDLLARMGGGLDKGITNVKTPSQSSGSSSGGGTGQLTAAQLKDVVMRNRKNLQRCYEVALRGSGSTETVKMEVEIQVSPNGNVTSVQTNGKGLADMDSCISKSVRMWRFPKSGETTQTRFPVVFQPGG